MIYCECDYFFSKLVSAWTYIVRRKILVSNILIVGERTNALLINILVFLMVYLYNVFRILTDSKLTS